MELKASNVVVVGGGVGGLAVAARIACNSSAKVTIIEKNDFLGGRCGSFNVDVPALGDFRHERGPSLLLLPHIYRELFQDCSSTPEEHGLAFSRCTPAYQVVFEDGDRIDVGFPRENGEIGDDEKATRERMDLMEDHGSSKWDAYLRACEAYLECGFPNFIEERLELQSFPAFLRESLRDFGKAWPLKPHSDVLDNFFASAKMRALASFQDLYVGLTPYRDSKKIAGGVLTTTAPAVFGLLSAIELHPSNKMCGVYAPLGGFDVVTKSLVSLASNSGVAFITNASVTRVSDGVVEYQTPMGTEHVEADAVIVNADLPYASKVLLEGASGRSRERYDWDDRYLFSSGVIAFHWSLKKRLHDLRTHNVFLATGSRDWIERSWSATTNSGDFWSDPFNFYVHRASDTDPTAAPEDCDSIMVLVPCAALDRDPLLAKLSRDEAVQGYSAKIKPETIDCIRRAVFKRLAAVESLKSLSSEIVHETVDTPATYADLYHVGAGTPFALSHGFKQLSITRPGTRHSDPSVFFCGASTRPGNGVPLVLVGAKQVSCQVLKKLSVDR